MTTSPDLELEAVVVTDLVKEYGDVRAIDEISFTVKRGEIFGLLGPNGAGKTTTIECLVGLRPPTSGTMRVLGMAPDKNRRRFTERVSIQPQSASLFDTLTVDETLRLFASFYQDALEPNDVRGEVRLDEQARTRVKHLSGGQLRRLLLGIALIGKPELVVLDEPSAGLDPTARHHLWDTIRDLAASGTTVILSTHHMEEATELCDRVAIVVRGRIVALDTPDALIRARDAESVVTFHVPPGTDPTSIRTLADASDLTITDHGAHLQIEVRTPDPDSIVRKITFLPGITARDFDIRRGTLEDLFIELSKSDEPQSTEHIST